MKKIKIPIDVRLPQALEGAHAAVESAAAAYAEQLCAGLHIPARIQVQVAISDGDAEGGLQLRIGGQAGRVRYIHSLPETFPEILPAGASVCEEICRNRVLLATPEVCAYAAQQAPEAFRSFSPAEQHLILCRLFQMGFGIERLRQLDTADPADAADSRRAVEHCIGELEACSAAIYGSAPDINPDEDPNDLNRLVEALDLATDTIFKQNGIPAPAIRPAVRGDLPPGLLQFRFNDLYFPARQQATIIDQYQYLLELLREFGYLFINRGSVAYLLESLETANPNLLGVFRAKSDPDILALVLRTLILERMPVRGLLRLLEILIAAEDRYVTPRNTWFPTPISENILFLAEDKPWTALTASDWSDFVRMYYKSGLRSLARPAIDADDTDNIRVVNALQLHDFFKRLQSADADEKTVLQQSLHRQIARYLQDVLHSDGMPFCINTVTAHRRLLQDAVRMEFPEIAVFSNQELLLINLTAVEVGQLGGE